MSDALFSFKENKLKSFKDFIPARTSSFPLDAFPFSKPASYTNEMKIFTKFLLALFVLTTLPFSQSATGQETNQQTRPASTWSVALINSARAQVGVTLIYDGRYQSLAFPNGDIPRLRGVCTDVVIRALRDAHGLDLQAEVNADMKANFSAYPKNWGLKRTDRNIDHRRVPNLQTYFNRHGAALPVTNDASDYQPGDIVTWMLPGNLPHIGIVTDQMNTSATRPMIVHNIGWGTRVNDMLFDYDITGHYRIEPTLN